jgi:nitrate reductase NapAB chaperone NapD
MTIQSYLVYPQLGHIQQVLQTLQRIHGCQAFPAANRNVLVLVTETNDRGEQTALEQRMEQLPGVECLALVSAWSE